MQHVTASNVALVSAAIGIVSLFARVLLARRSPTLSILSSGGDGGGADARSTLPSEETAPREPRPDSELSIGRLPGDWGTALAPLSVLVVEGDDASRQWMTDTLAYHGARVLAVRSAAEAVQALEVHHADVLISDLRLPEQDGLALIQELRTWPDPAVALIPAASMTALRQVNVRQHALAAGFQVHIDQPFDPDGLVSTVLTLARTSRRACSMMH